MKNIALTLCLLVSAPAWASRLAMTIMPVELKEIPKKEAVVVKKITRGTFVVSSNNPVDGFYKVRLKDQSVGWIAADQITFDIKRGDEKLNSAFKNEADENWMR